MVIFDLDDTLFFEIDFVKSAYKAIARELSEQSPMGADEIEGLLLASASMTEGIDRLIAKLNSTSGERKFTPEMLVEIYRNHMPDISLREGAHELLDALRKQGIKIGMITDGRIATQTNKFNALGLGKYISPDNLLISEMIGADKTTPTPFETMMRLNPDESRMVYIGDNPAKDFRWPNAMGWLTVEIHNPSGIGLYSQNIDVDNSWHARYIVEALPDALVYITDFH